MALRGYQRRSEAVRPVEEFRIKYSRLNFWSETYLGGPGMNLHVRISAGRKGAFALISYRGLRVPVQLLLLFCVFGVAACQEEKPKTPPTPGPMLHGGTIDLETPDFDVSLVRSSQTIAALKPKTADGFDFTPGDLLVARSQSGFMHLGDITVRLRTRGTGAWKNYSTATERSPVKPLPASAGILAAADLAPTLPADIPLEITREWGLDHGILVLRFRLKNKASNSVEIGAL